MARRVRSVCEGILARCWAFLMNSIRGKNRRISVGSIVSDLRKWKSRDIKKTMERAG